MDVLSGIELSRRYWLEVVAPIIDDLLPGVPRAAARVGAGSDVLGFDDERSTDHGWGPRVVIFVDNLYSDNEKRKLVGAIDARIPVTFLGWPTRFAATSDGSEQHQVALTTVRAWFMGTLGFDPSDDITPADWLSAPSQILRTSIAGAVFEDATGDLTRVRERLSWYPDDVWLYLLGCQWRRIDQEEPFVGRAGEASDDLGSAVVAARLVRDLMRLCFLIERQYAPYSKWLGTAFSRLRCGSTLAPMLRAALAATDWRSREGVLVPVYEHVARMFNALGLTEPEEPTVRYFYNRPFRVLNSGRFVAACMAKTALAHLGDAGSIDQFVDNTDVLSNREQAAGLRDFIVRRDPRRI